MSVTNSFPPAIQSPDFEKRSRSATSDRRKPYRPRSVSIRFVSNSLTQVLSSSVQATPRDPPDEPAHAKRERPLR